MSHRTPYDSPKPLVERLMFASLRDAFLAGRFEGASVATRDANNRRQKLVEAIRAATRDHERAEACPSPESDYEDGLDDGAAIRSAQIRRILIEGQGIV